MSRELSLLDCPGYKTRTWFLVYHPREPYYGFTKYLKQGFRHVELTRPYQYGPGVSDVMWLNILPNFEMLDAEISMDPTPPWIRCPGSTCQKVTAARLLTTMRSWFDVGPTSCVEIAKMALGIRAFWVRTPHQLYRYIQRRDGVIISKG